MRTRRLILGALLSFPLMACSPGVSQSTSTASSGPPQPTERPTATLAATPEFPAPPELQGTWTAVTKAGDDLELEIREVGYTLSLLRDLGPERSSGRVVVDDDEIVFSNSNLCVGDGRYRWSIDDGILRFEALAPDACPGRAHGLEDIDYRPSE